ncbi:MAG: PhnD/SsuA/transferrin family substrate-binding protein [Gammaproteobacteria bacterium]|nr:PhnD/SsuA/transferrin family substrate-binding protein [Gammaproteobacteria bacterium]
MFTSINSRKWLRSTSMGILATLFAANASAEIIFSAAPRETPEEGQALYGPMVEAMSEALGEKVVYQHPGSWRNYQKKVKSGEYDIYLDGAHLAAWRMENQQAKPLVRLPGELSFVLVSNADNKAITTPEDLIARKICHMPSPNLGTLTLFSIYDNPVRQPNFVVVNGGAKKLMAAMDAGKCDATILRKKFYHKKLDRTAQAKFNVLTTTDGITNQGFTISNRVDEATVIAIQNYLTSDEGKAAAQKLLKRFSPGTEKFVASNQDEYQGLNLMAKNTMFGW